ncbi:MBOAT family O-acyltransferase [Chitinimonas sp.]|uniref:MBOAT family O-acyltransferase n=1 Tax=Chitinimonas sp. TaxID=1934313 RepID=UPI0035AF053D
MVPAVALGLATGNYLLFILPGLLYPRLRTGLHCASLLSWCALLGIAEWHGWVRTLGQPASTTALASLLGLPFLILTMIAYNVAHWREPERHASPRRFVAYLVYCLYFPRFLCGPLETANWLNRLEHFRWRLCPRHIDVGLRWILLGAVYNLVAASLIRQYWQYQGSNPLLGALAGATAFELQVYCDFAGYSMMAVGAGWILNLRITMNFHSPFFASNLRDFWQRWHTSLGRWLREHLFQPMRQAFGPSRASLILATMLTFLVSALWHGLTLNFLLWGAWHALAFLSYVLWFSRSRRLRWLGLPALWLVLIMGRLLFMSNRAALAKHFQAFTDLQNWQTLLPDLFTAIGGASALAWFGIALFAVLMLGEALSLHSGRPYRLLLKPALRVPLAALLLLAVEAGSEGAVYAGI